MLRRATKHTKTHETTHGKTHENIGQTHENTRKKIFPCCPGNSACRPQPFPPALSHGLCVPSRLLRCIHRVAITRNHTENIGLFAKSHGITRPHTEITRKITRKHWESHENTRKNFSHFLHLLWAYLFSSLSVRFPPFSPPPVHSPSAFRSVKILAIRVKNSVTE